MRSLFTFLLTCIIFSSQAQDFSYPILNTTGLNISDFVPPGWVIHATASGDLNKDKQNDIVIVLQHKDSVRMVKADDPLDTVITQPRMLAIIFRDSVKKYILAEQCNSFILNHDNPVMDDPFEGIKIENGILQIDFRFFYSMGSWYVSSSSYKFRYLDKQFALIGADYSSFHRASHDYEDYSYNFLTKKRSLTTGNDNNKTKKVSWKVLNIPVLKNFTTFKAPSTWEVETDVYL